MQTSCPGHGQARAHAAHILSDDVERSTFLYRVVPNNPCFGAGSTYLRAARMQAPPAHTEQHRSWLCKRVRACARCMRRATRAEPCAHLSDSSPPATLPYVSSLMPLADTYCSMPPSSGRRSSRLNCTCGAKTGREHQQNALGEPSCIPPAARLRLRTWLLATGTPASTMLLSACTFMFVVPTCSAARAGPRRHVSASVTTLFDAASCCQAVRQSHLRLTCLMRPFACRSARLLATSTMPDMP